MIHGQAYDLVISNYNQTLSGKVFILENLPYTRYSIFFNQEIVEIGPSHILISKRVSNSEYKWMCEEKSSIWDEELAGLVGAEIDRMFGIIKETDLLEG